MQFELEPPHLTLITYSLPLSLLLHLPPDGGQEAQLVAARQVGALGEDIVLRRLDLPRMPR